MTEQGSVVIGRYIPGDLIRANLGLENSMNLMFASVLLQNETAPDFVLELKTDNEILIGAKGYDGGQTVQIEGRVTLDIPPGTYNLYRVFCVTYGGRTIRLEGGNLGNLQHYQIEIIPEPSEYPSVTGFALRD